MSERPSRSARAVIDELCAEAVRYRQPICLDSGPLIDYIARLEPVATLLSPILDQSDVPAVISTISLAELVGRPATAGHIQRVAAIHRGLRGLANLTILGLDEDHAIEAAIVRGFSGLRLPDAAVIATARLASARALIGNDRQWRNKPLGVTYIHLDDILGVS